MADFPPQFFVGKGDTETGISINNADPWINGVTIGNFPLGTYIWTAASDYSNPVYRGTVLEHSGSSIRCSIVAPAAQANATVWHPNGYWIPTYAAASPSANELDLGVANIESLDRTLFRAQIRDERELIVFTWVYMDISDLSAWRTWLIDEISSGVDAFTLRWYDHLSASTRLGSCKLENSEHIMRNARWGMGPLTLSVVLQTEDSYS